MLMVFTVSVKWGRRAFFKWNLGIWFDHTCKFYLRHSESDPEKERNGENFSSENDDGKESRIAEKNLDDLLKKFWGYFE